MNSAKKLSAYRANAVGSAKSENLVVMLFDGAIRFLGAAIRAFDHEDPLDFNLTIHTNITKTQAIIRELNNALDLDNGGELGQNLTSLYNYFDQRLQEANIHKDRAIIEEILARISELRDAWNESLDQKDEATQTKNSSSKASPPGSYSPAPPANISESSGLSLLG